MCNSNLLLLHRQYTTLGDFKNTVTVHSGSSPEPTVAGVILQAYNWKMTNIWSVEFCKASREHLGC